jgi:hypothetical protein
VTNNLVGLAKRLLPEWVVLLRLMSERTGGNLQAGQDLDKNCGESDVHEGVGWIASVLVRSDEAAETSVTTTKSNQNT